MGTVGGGSQQVQGGFQDLDLDSYTLLELGDGRGEAIKLLPQQDLGAFQLDAPVSLCISDRPGETHSCG